MYNPTSNGWVLFIVHILISIKLSLAIPNSVVKVFFFFSEGLVLFSNPICIFVFILGKWDHWCWCLLMISICWFLLFYCIVWDSPPSITSWFVSLELLVSCVCMVWLTSASWSFPFINFCRARLIESLKSEQLSRRTEVFPFQIWLQYITSCLHIP